MVSGFIPFGLCVIPLELSAMLGRNLLFIFENKPVHSGHVAVQALAFMEEISLRDCVSPSLCTEVV